MYNEEVNTSNKVIKKEDLLEIFEKMNEKLQEYKKIYVSEELSNRTLNYNYQQWTFKDGGSKLSFDVNFYDNTDIKFDNYNNFISIFSSRIDEVKSIYVRLYLNYSISNPSMQSKYYSQSINMYIYEHKMDINVSLSSEDRKLDDIYELIKDKIRQSNDKYDYVIKKKKTINNTVGFAIGAIPAIIISTSLLFIKIVRQIYASSYVAYPILCILLALFIGCTISSMLLEKYYKKISPDKKYAGYDSTNHTSVYKDDLDKYISTAQIEIGKNVGSTESRNKIMQYQNKYKKFIPIELIVIAVISVVVLFLGNV